MASSNLIEIYKSLKKGEETYTGKLSAEFIVSCFKYGYFIEKPTKKHKEWWKEVFECEYPECIEDIPKDVIKELKDFIKKRKKDEEMEEKWKMQRYERGYSDCDCWDIYGWFLEIMPKMLQQMRDNLHGYPSDITSQLMPNNQAVSDTAIDENAEEEPGFIKWKETLDRMIFLLHEMDEDKCSYENPYEKERLKMDEDFRKKYGPGGENLKSEQDKAKEKKEGLYKAYSPRDFPELYPQAAELDHKWFMYEIYKGQYRDKCREEFFNLFSKHFWDLWD